MNPPTAYIQPARGFQRSAMLFLMVTAINGIILSAWQLFFNFYMLQSGHDSSFLGMVNSLPSIAGLVLGVPIGWLTDFFGYKRSIFIGIFLGGLAMLGQVTFHKPYLIMAMAFLAGAFNMFYYVSIAPMMVKLSDTGNRTLLFSLNYGLQTIAGAVGSLFAGRLPAWFGNILHVQPESALAYQAVLVVAVLLGISALIPLWLIRETKTNPPVKTNQTQAGFVETESASKSRLARMTIKMAMPNLLIGFGAAILIPYMNVFFKNRFAVPDAKLGIIFSLSSLMIGIGSLIAPRLAVWTKSKVRAVAFTQFSSLIFLMILGFTGYFWLAVVGFLMRTMLMNMAAPLYSAFCMEQTPERNQGLVNSVLNLSWQAGWAVGPYLSGLVQIRYGFSPLFLTTGILYFLAIVSMWMFFRKAESNVS